MATFIASEVEVFFASAPTLTKRTGVPDSFTWSGERFLVEAVLSEWHEYDKRRERDTTRRSQAQLVRKGGSWGLGKDFYRVRTTSGRVFDLYFDRRPKGPDVVGAWVLFRELDPSDLSSSDQAG